jgi:hypothetical protein
MYGSETIQFLSFNLVFLVPVLVAYVPAPTARLVRWTSCLVSDILFFMLTWFILTAYTPSYVTNLVAPDYSPRWIEIFPEVHVVSFIGGLARSIGVQGGEESDRQVQEVCQKDEGAKNGSEEQSLLKGMR